MVLHGILEDFLHGAGAAGGVDDAAEGQGEDVVFPDAVGKELGNMCGKGRGWLMPIEPGGDAQADIVGLGVFVSNQKSPPTRGRGLKHGRSASNLKV